MVLRSRMKPMSQRSFIFLCALVLGCSGTDDGSNQGESGSTLCNPGDSVACACQDGSEAMQVCADDGVSYSPCACGVTGSGGAVGSSGGGTGTGGTTGSGGLAGSGGVAGTGGVAGQAGAGGTAGQAGAGGQGGTAGQAGAGGAAGAGGTGGGTPGTQPTMLPTAQQPCQPFVTGGMTILGLPLTVWAGAPQNNTGSLILYWHGTGSNGQEAVTGLGQSSVDQITAGGGIVIGFEGTTAQGQNTGNNVWYTGDFAVADEIVACGIELGHIDPRRIYTGGYSAGGLQVGRMAYDRSGYLAAVLVYSGGAFGGQPQDPQHFPAAVGGHGAPGSDVLILDFGQGTHDFLVNGPKAYGRNAIDCNDGGSHISGQRFAIGPNAWQFFQDHPFGVSPPPYSALPPGFPSYCELL